MVGAGGLRAGLHALHTGQRLCVTGCAAARTAPRPARGARARPLRRVSTSAGQRWCCCGVLLPRTQSRRPLRGAGLSVETVAHGRGATPRRRCMSRRARGAHGALTKTLQNKQCVASGARTWSRGVRAALPCAASAERAASCVPGLQRARGRSAVRERSASGAQRQKSQFRSECEWCDDTGRATLRGSQHSIGPRSQTFSRDPGAQKQSEAHATTAHLPAHSSEWCHAQRACGTAARGPCCRQIAHFSDRRRGERCARAAGRPRARRSHPWRD